MSKQEHQGQINYVQIFINKGAILFLAAFIVTFLPVARENMEQYEVYYMGLLIFLQFIFMIWCFCVRTDRFKLQSAADIIMIVFGFLLLFDLFTTRLDLIKKFLFPAPGYIVYELIQEFPAFVTNLVSSSQLLITGYLLAVVTAIPLGLIVGWRRRLYQVASPISRVLAPIPPIVYIPYAIAIFPTFKMSSIFIIFIGAFWPIFVNTLSGTLNIERRIIDSARALNVSEATMLFKVILPGIMPSVMSGINIGLLLSFILLNSAEMIGAVAGLGWYIKYFADFADYTKVIVGIIYISLVVIVCTSLMGRVEKYLLRWKN